MKTMMSRYAVVGRTQTGQHWDLDRNAMIKCIAEFQDYAIHFGERLYGSVSCARQQRREDRRPQQTAVARACRQQYAYEAYGSQRSLDIQKTQTWKRSVIQHMA